MKRLALYLVSLFLAVVIWSFVSAPRREKPTERKFAAPLSLVGIRPTFIITTPVPDTVSVRLRGRSSDLRTVLSQSLEVPIDLTWVARPGKATITLYPQALRLNVPEDIEVLSIEPNKFEFTVEQLRQRAVPIRPFVYGEVPAGYLAEKPVLAPDRALVSGPESQVLAMSEVSTERINMSGRTETFVQRVTILSDSQLVRVIEPRTTNVTVTILAPVGPAQPPPDATGTAPTTSGTAPATTTEQPSTTGTQ